MPVKRRIPKTLRTQLTHAEEAELWLGPRSKGPLFKTEKAVRAAWFANRDRLMRWWGSHGRRPQAWWHLEGPCDFPGLEFERSTLYAFNLLTTNERAELEAFWREQFTRAQRPGFSFCAGPEGIVTGRLAQRAAYRAADIPRILVAGWLRDYRRRGKVIRKLEATSSQPSQQSEPAA
jgi:hypothetical protein